MNYPNLKLLFEITDQSLSARKRHPLLKSLKKGTLIADALSEFNRRNPIENSV